MIKLLKYLKKYKKQTILGPIFKMLEAFFELLVPIAMARLIDIGIANQDKSYIYKMGLILVVLALVGYLSSVTCQYFASFTSQGFGTELRNALFVHITTFSHQEIDESGAPTLITRLSQDIIQLQLAIAMFIRLAFRTPFIIIGATIFAFYIDFKLSLIFLLTTPALAFCIYLIIKLSTPIYKRIQKRLDQVGLIFRENLTGIRIVRAFSREKAEIKRFNKELELQKDDAIKVGKIIALNNPLTLMILNFAIMLILYQGGIRVNYGELTQGEVLALVSYLSQILLALLALSMILSVFNKAIVSGKRVQEVLDYSVSLKNPITEKEVNINSDHLEFNNVSFKYNKAARYVLKNIDFKIKRGAVIGIIGGTGAGKSTLVHLISRFYDVSTGKLVIDGIDVKEHTLKSLRKKVAVVPQQSTLFSGTIRDNMKLGNPFVTDEEIFKALELAQASEFVLNLPNVLNEMVTQGGKNFSGGQKQRLCIARALVIKPAILILDDSASALDFVTDAKLRQAISTIKQEMTVIIVSQRSSSINHCDSIIVLDQGQIVGNGKHRDLLEQCQIYKEICLSQLSQEEVLQ
jgi:ABC-type multidrug transport system, ATPase and permease components